MYQVYPTLLDAFLRYKGSADYAEADIAYRELIDKINRVQTEKPDHVKDGIAFKKCVDYIIKVSKEQRRDILECFPEDGMYGYFDHETQWNFDCKVSVLRKFVQKFMYSLSEYFIEGIVNTKHGEVRLYGFVDNLFRECGFDVKYVKKYELAKYFGSVQRILYPVCASKQGAILEQFEFWATNGEEIFVETYNVNLERDEAVLIKIVEDFLDFVIAHRSFITDEKLFGVDAEMKVG